MQKIVRHRDMSEIRAVAGTKLKASGTNTIHHAMSESLSSVTIGALNELVVPVLLKTGSSTGLSSDPSG